MWLFMGSVVALALIVDAYRRWNWRLLDDGDGRGLDDLGHAQLADRQLYQDVGHTAPDLLSWTCRDGTFGGGRGRES